MINAIRERVREEVRKNFREFLTKEAERKSKLRETKKKATA